MSSGTTIEDARTNILASSQQQVDHLNANLKSIYLGGFNGWAAGVLAGKITNANPPQPPMGYELAAPDTWGFVFPVLGTSPVCSVPTIPANVLNAAPIAQGTVDVGADLGGGWFAAGPNDRVASGTVIVLPNGLKLTKVGFFMGNGWYQVTH